MNEAIGLAICMVLALALTFLVVEYNHETVHVNTTGMDSIIAACNSACENQWVSNKREGGDAFNCYNNECYCDC